MAKGRAKRKRPKPHVRLKIFERDGWACVHCGQSRRHLLTIDHIVPASRGGTAVQENLQTLCRRCNEIKGNDTIGVRRVRPDLA